MLRKPCAAALLLAISVLIHAAEPARPSRQTIQTWQARKFGMFIHFGIFSALGGVWKGEPVTRGYSEQIMRFMPGTAAEYAAMAKEFNPSKWDPEAIVKLAQDAGMKFIVITSKHHDGFNMFQTKLTDYNIVDGSPYHRDVIKGLADACARHGMSFGVYYSTIDWHDPRATGPSAPPIQENDNPIPKSHEDFNVAQLEELTTRYGRLSEIWFDMGQPTPEQSRRFTATVHRFQPECMVSGRVFNSQGDFTVMGDNQIPTTIIDEPWQTPGSIYHQTWGYRSWQDRIDLPGKTREHILKLVQVASRGGNYLLNIGPRGDGSVVEFEADVLHGIGEWLRANKEAIYDSQPQPFKRLDFGYATVKPGKLYLLVSNWPAGGRLELPGLRTPLKRAWLLADPTRKFTIDNQAHTITAADVDETPPVTVVVAEYDGPLNVIPPSIEPGANGAVTLETARADRYFNYNGRGYYDPPTVYKLHWDFAVRDAGAYVVSVTYRGGSSSPLAFSIGGQTLTASLNTERTNAALGTVKLAIAESVPLIVTPKSPFAKGDKLGVEIERVTLTPAAR